MDYQISSANRLVEILPLLLLGLVGVPNPLPLSLGTRPVPELIRAVALDQIGSAKGSCSSSGIAVAARPRPRGEAPIPVLPANPEL